MKAVRYHGPGIQFRLEQVPEPEPAIGEVRVRIPVDSARVFVVRG